MRSWLRKSSWKATRKAAADSRRSSKYVAASQYLHYLWVYFRFLVSLTNLCIFLGEKRYSREAAGPTSKGREKKNQILQRYFNNRSLS